MDMGDQHHDAFKRFNSSHHNCHGLNAAPRANRLTKPESNCRIHYSNQNIQRYSQLNTPKSHHKIEQCFLFGRARTFSILELENFDESQRLGKYVRMLPDRLEIHHYGGMEGIFGFSLFPNFDSHPFYVFLILPFQIVGLSSSILFQRHVTPYPNYYWQTCAGGSMAH